MGPAIGSTIPLHQAESFKKRLSRPLDVEGKLFACSCRSRHTLKGLGGNGDGLIEGTPLGHPLPVFTAQVVLECPEQETAKTPARPVGPRQKLFLEDFLCNEGLQKVIGILGRKAGCAHQESLQDRLVYLKQAVEC
jgi:hypothetical protein